MYDSKLDRIYDSMHVHRDVQLISSVLVFYCATASSFLCTTTYMFFNIVFAKFLKQEYWRNEEKIICFPFTCYSWHKLCRMKYYFGIEY